MAEERLTVGEMVRRLRQSKGLSLTAVAKKAGISKAYLSQLENDPTKNPSAEVVLQLANALDVPITELLGLEEQPLNNQSLPPALSIFWGEYPEIPADDIRALAQVQYEGKRPFTPTDYWLIYETIRVTATRHLRSTGEQGDHKGD